MKNITINNNVWKELKKIKKKHNFKQIGQAVEYLQNHQLLPEATMKDQVSVGKHSGFLEEKTTIKHSSAISFLCFRCNNSPFKIDEIALDETTGIVCPHCGYRHRIAVFQGETSPETQDSDHGENSKHSRRKDISEIRKHVDLLIKTKDLKNLVSH